MHLCWWPASGIVICMNQYGGSSLSGSQCILFRVSIDQFIRFIFLKTLKRSMWHFFMWWVSFYLKYLLVWHWMVELSCSSPYNTTPPSLLLDWLWPYEHPSRSCWKGWVVHNLSTAKSDLKGPYVPSGLKRTVLLQQNNLQSNKLDLIYQTSIANLASPVIFLSNVLLWSPVCYLGSSQTICWPSSCVIVVLSTVYLFKLQPIFKWISACCSTVYLVCRIMMVVLLLTF